MTFCIITHVHHSQSNGSFFGYAPYVNEMNIWIKNADKIIIVAPLMNFSKSAIHQNYIHENIEFIAVPDFSVTSFKAICKTVFYLPKILFSIFKAMNNSNHIHLRCPGNMGLLGSIIQILFPKTKKTAKYAGNFDPNAKQPTSYKLQKYILSNTFLTRNMQVLVYGNWKNQSKNIKPFFTATYSEKDRVEVAVKNLNSKIEVLFVGSLTSGKRPIVAIKIVEQLKKIYFNIQLSIYGEGVEQENLEHYIVTNNLSEFIFLKGNRSKNEMITIYQKSHFLILPSKSEGWPKVIAEAMFWGCLPIATPISCIPTMLDNESRGILLSNSFDDDIIRIKNVINNQDLYTTKIKEALNWSRNFTIDKFEQEIKKLVST